ncbi:MAG: hypothetical protein H9928_06540 [Candidatus Phocaeicola excrementipullorum]|uniref:Transmembrane protein n=3 Tax=Bacteroidaceae TaxID=815 RepID=A0ABT7VCY7_9BACE|nr:hypothetical protein [Candidatus Phocaeicola excrementipullorum]MDM8324156.1 hypothetical protein [Bacteroides gallinaceum]
METEEFEASPRLRGKACWMSALLFVLVWLPVSYLLGAGWGKVIVNLSFGAVLAVVGLWHYRCSNPLTYKISLGSWAHRTYLKSPVLFVVESFAEGFLIYLGVMLVMAFFPDGFSLSAWRKGIVNCDIVLLLVFYTRVNFFLVISEYIRRNGR